MSDYISKKDVIEALTKDNLQKHIDSVKDGGQENRAAIRIIMEMPTADVEERKKGEWIQDNSYAYIERYICSSCRESYKVDTFMGKPMWNYCPNCGTDMRKEVIR